MQLTRDRIVGWLVGLLIVAGATAAAVADGREYSALEQLRIENVALKARLATAVAERDACQVRSEVARLKADIEAAHPDSTFNEKTGQLEPKPKGTP